MYGKECAKFVRPIHIYMTKIFLSNGCSHTAGSEIDPNSLRTCKEKAWPRFVAEHYGMNSVNIAEGGSGNEQISRSTMLNVISAIDQYGKDPNDIVVGILWSGFDRYEYWSPKHQEHRSFTMNVKKTPYTPEDVVIQYVEARSLVETKNYSNYKNLYYMLTTAKLLESYNIKYFFANGLQSFTNPKEFNDSTQMREAYFNIINLYGSMVDNHLGFYNKDQLFKNYLKDTPKSNLGTGSHWDEVGQEKYADYFIQHIEKHGGVL